MAHVGRRGQAGSVRRVARIALACPRCGGPLPPEAECRPIRCPYCRSTVLALPDLIDAARFRRAFDAYDSELEHAGPPGQRVLIGGVPYRLFGECGAGTTSVVRCGRRDRRITEEVVVKLPRHAEAAPRLEHEHQVLTALAASTARGAGHRSHRLRPRRHGLHGHRPGRRSGSGRRCCADGVGGGTHAGHDP